MTGHVVRRAVAGVLVLVTTTVLSYTLFLAGPFNSASVMCGARCTPDRYTAIRASLGADRPLFAQLASFFGGLFTGRHVAVGDVQVWCPAPCLGVSYDRREPVTHLIAQSLPVTASIALGGAVLGLVVGVALGTVAARRRGTLADRLIVGGSAALTAVPFYVVALLAYLVFVVRWGFVRRDGYHPLLGAGPLWSSVGPWFASLLPAWLMLGAYGAAGYTRYTRGLVVDVLDEDYVRTAVAKGLSTRRVLHRHALRSVYPPLATIFSLEVAGLLSGTIFVEQIFGLRGLGFLAFSSVGNRDLPVLVGTTLFAALLIVVANIVTDVVHARLDPRVRFS